MRGFNDDVELTVSTTVDQCRQAHLRAVFFYFAGSIHVGDRLPVSRITHQFDGVRDCGLMRIGSSLASGRRHGLS